MRPIIWNIKPPQCFYKGIRAFSIYVSKSCKCYKPVILQIPVLKKEKHFEVKLDAEHRRELLAHIRQMRMRLVGFQTGLNWDLMFRWYHLFHFSLLGMIAIFKRVISVWLIESDKISSWQDGLDIATLQSATKVSLHFILAIEIWWIALDD